MRSQQTGQEAMPPRSPALAEHKLACRVGWEFELIWFASVIIIATTTPVADATASGALGWSASPLWEIQTWGLHGGPGAGSQGGKAEACVMERGRRFGGSLRMVHRQNEAGTSACTQVEGVISFPCVHPQTMASTLTSILRGQASRQTSRADFDAWTERIM